ncbi:MAG: hypothetical protein HY728_10745 [Candidatus Rokubacteria bacterium]|nr:hypothetical protein [Candidatus Rokubacteria bacterium]
MTRRGRRVAGLAGVLAALALLPGCSVRRIEHGVYHSPKGYRVAIPGPEWEVIEASRADLELRHRTGAAGMLVHATCDAAARRRSPSALGRQLLAGLRERRILEQGEAAVNGQPATHTVLEALSGMDGEPVRIEVYTLRGERCVYDLIYAAPPASFSTGTGDFGRFVGAFATE